MNPMLNQLMSSMLGKNDILKMFHSVKNAQDPNAMIQSLMKTNPQIQQVYQVINQHGGNAKDAFYSVAQQRGINPDTILSQLK